MHQDYFPQGIAEGEAFLGRELEIDVLENNIRTNHHTLLIAPRRYGKTSLALHVLKKLKIPNVEINFFLAVTEKAVERKIIVGVENLIKAISSKPAGLIRNLQNFFKTSDKRWEFSFKGLSLELTPDEKSDPASNIQMTLELAEYLLAKKKQKAVIFLDEVQEFEALREGRAIEGAIREFAQKSNYLTFIFSGSNRRLLKHMFDNSVMPLYELCDRIQLERIQPDVYKHYLQKIAKKTWKQPLPDKVIDAIIDISQCHPRRIYNLCHTLWQRNQHKELPKTAAAVASAWEYLLTYRLKDLRYTLHKSLSSGQIKVLSLVSAEVTSEFTGKIAQGKTGLSGPTILNHLKSLEDLDYLERDVSGRYRIIDPMIDDMVKRYELVNLV